MIVTMRDKKLFEKIYTHAVMTTRQVAENCFIDVSLSTVLRRLRKLEHAGFIKRVPGLSTYEMCWVLTEKAATLISDKPPKWRQSRFLLEHDTKLTALRMSLEKSGLARSWIAEHEIRSKVAAQYGRDGSKNKLVPDGIIGVKIDDVNESIALELELTAKSKSRYEHNFYQYQHKRSLFGVWYLTPTLQLAKHIECVWQKEVRKDCAPLFYWSLADEVILNPLSAMIFSGSRSWSLPELFQAKTTFQGAHTPAQRVSRDFEKKEVS